MRKPEWLKLSRERRTIYLIRCRLYIRWRGAGEGVDPSFDRRGVFAALGRSIGPPRGAPPSRRGSRTSPRSSGRVRRVGGGEGRKPRPHPQRLGGGSRGPRLQLGRLRDGRRVPPPGALGGGESRRERGLLGPLDPGGGDDDRDWKARAPRHEGDDRGPGGGGGPGHHPRGLLLDIPGVQGSSLPAAGGGRLLRRSRAPDRRRALLSRRLLSRGAGGGRAPRDLAGPGGGGAPGKPRGLQPGDGRAEGLRPDSRPDRLRGRDPGGRDGRAEVCEDVPGCDIQLRPPGRGGEGPRALEGGGRPPRGRGDRRSGEPRDGEVPLDKARRPDQL
ncbi:MAG: hypothetical protein A4E51_01662 [Methanosaeta sp. PtaU1.Bin055]|nr:MAG: hypothetical protein A4E51_01662 [Methanosaeta sp. PtaU1.Bin055]